MSELYINVNYFDWLTQDDYVTYVFCKNSGGDTGFCIPDHEWEIHCYAHFWGCFGKMGYIISGVYMCLTFPPCH